MTSPDTTAKPASKSFGNRIAALSEGLRYLTTGNPVLVKEFRIRMRGVRAYWLLFGYALFLAAVILLMYFSHYMTLLAMTASSNGGLSGGGSTGAQLGSSLYAFLFVAQAILVALITPAITAGAITMEHEQRSYELLVTTPLRPQDVVRGKLLAATAFVVLLLTASLPLVSISFLVGGVSPGEIFGSYLIIATSAALYGAIGLYWSAKMRTTTAATAISYLTVLTLFVLTTIPGFTALAVSGNTPTITGIPFQSVNGITATYRAVAPENLFSIHFYSWIPGLIVNLLGALVISIAAVQNLVQFTPIHSRALRLSSTLLWFLICLHAIGNSDVSGLTSRSSILTILTLIILTLAVLAPILNTGERRQLSNTRALSDYLSGLSPWRLFGDSLSNGLPLILLWALFPAVFLGCGYLTQGTLGISTAANCAAMAGVFLLTATVLATFGHWMSVILPTRWAAQLLIYTFAMLLFVAPYLQLQIWRASDQPPEFKLFHQLIYLCPTESLRYLDKSASYFISVPLLAFGETPVWIVHCLLLGMLSLVFFSATLFVLARRQSRARIMAKAE